MRLTFLSSFFFLVATTLADVKFVGPAPGATTSSNAQISISWTEGGGANPISKLTGYTIFLMVGGSTEATAQPLANLAGSHTTSTSGTAVLRITSPAIGPPGVNAYYLKMTSVGANGLTVINYSERFTIPGMTGSWPSSAIQTAYTQAKGDVTAVPDTQVQNAGAQAPGAPAGGPQFEVPFLSQTTGLIRYAPMMNYPGTAITKTNTERLNPTSKWSLATAYLPPATVTLTVTASGTHSVVTIENTEAPVSTSLNAMEKYLNRWKD